jgi:predicted PurR-regulated permease PerM
MPDRTLILPLYARIALTVVAMIGIGFILYIGKSVIIPFLFALLLAILLNPAVKRMEAWGINRVLAIGLVVLGAMVLLGGVAYFVADQAMRFISSMDDLKGNLVELGHDAKAWLQGKLDVQRAQMDALEGTVVEEGEAKGSAVVKDTITTVGALFAFFFLLPVCTFLFLLYERFLLGFVARLFPQGQHGTVSEVLTNAEDLIQGYLRGLLVQALIVAVLNVAGLWIIGVEYALLLGVLGALLNMVPYIGGLVATGLAMVVALATMEPSAALWVLGLFLVVQFLDNNVIVPLIVASRIQVNALVAFAVVLWGGAFWGVAGMFLVLPFTAILKVVCDRVQGLQALGYLLGSEQKEVPGSIIRLRRPKAG